jgi:DHA2 family multidrug resistance protein
MMVVTPFIGRIYNKVSPRLVVGIGIVLVAIGNLLQSRSTLDSSMWNIVYNTAIQGVGFACLFVPLTTVALSSIQRHQLSDATGLNSLFRQVGGSIGLAMFATLLTHYTEPARAAISAHTAATNPRVGARLAQITQAFVARGYDPQTASGAAKEALYGIIARQATVLSFEKVFLLAGIVFLMALPLLYFLRSPHHGRSEPIHVEM